MSSLSLFGLGRKRPRNTEAVVEGVLEITVSPYGGVLEHEAGDGLVVDDVELLRAELQTEHLRWRVYDVVGHRKRVSDVSPPHGYA